MSNINNKSFFKIPWIICTLIATTIAIIYFFVWPQDLNATGMGLFILQYAHSLVWVLLAVASFVMYVNKPFSLKLASLLAKTSLFVYVVFLLTFAGYSIF